jgi:hypothetical protein
LQLGLPVGWKFFQREGQNIPFEINEAPNSLDIQKFQEANFKTLNKIGK